METTENKNEIIESEEMLQEFNNLTDIERKKFLNEILVSTELEMHSGPIPSPKVLEKYEKICIGSADRIIRMAEENQKANIAYRDKLLDAEIRDSKSKNQAAVLTLFLIFFVVVIFFAIAMVVVLTGHSTQGIVLGFTGLVALCGVFYKVTKR